MKRIANGIRPYSARPTQDLLYVARVLKERDMAVPTDLAAALNERGIEVSSV